jgi:hypothetical protein
MQHDDDDDDDGSDDLDAARGVMSGLLLPFLMGAVAWALMQAFL